MKRGLKGLIGLMIVAVAVLIIASEISNTVSSLSPDRWQNVSKTITLNVTLAINGSLGFPTTVNNTVNVTFMWSNLTDAYIYNTTVTNTTQNQSNFSTTFNTANLADGLYNLSVNITNSTGGSHQNVSSFGGTGIDDGFGFNISVDNTAPNVTLLFNANTGIPVQDGSNFSASAGNKTFNLSSVDFRPNSIQNLLNGTINYRNYNTSVVYLWFDNGTGKDFNLTLTNVTGPGYTWSISYNVSSLFEGKQGVRVMVNDTHNNINSTEVFNFTVDRTAPVMTSFSTSNVGSTSAKITVVTNETVSNCTYASVAGAQGSVGSGNLSVTTAGTLTSYSKTFSSLSAGTGYSVEVTCTDFVGYQVTNGISWSTSAAATTSSGGSGSGGSGSGVSTGVQGSFEKKVWTSINAGETASVTLKNGVVGVTEVSLTVPETVYGAWIQVAKKDSLPSSVSSFSGKVYKNVEITKGPALAKEGAYTDATVKFKVEKAWLAENQLTKESVALHHYADGKWAELTTQVGEDDGTYVHYSAKTPSFSYFVIGQKSGAVSEADLAAEQQPVAEPTEQPAVEAPAVEEVPAAAEEKQGMSKGLLVALLAAVVVVVAVVLYMRKRK